MSIRAKSLKPQAESQTDQKAVEPVRRAEHLKILRPGMICPRCKGKKIEYNSLLNLVCPNCGLTEAGAST